MGILQRGRKTQLQNPPVNDLYLASTNSTIWGRGVFLSEYNSYNRLTGIRTLDIFVVLIQVSVIKGIVSPYLAINNDTSHFFLSF